MKIFESLVSIFKSNGGRLPTEAVVPPHRKNPEGFTLIELLIVIAIIAILAALTLNTAGFIQKKAARSRTETEIAALSAALESYKADNGDYPAGTNTSSSGDNSFLRTNLSPASGKVYFEFSKTMGDDLVSGNIVDPFGESYLYQYPGNANRSGTNFFDLWSQAASGAVKSNLWIKNW
jgi:type II secretion system protein G